MRRRTFLARLGAAGLASAAPAARAQGSGRPPRVAVVGAGILGASIAYHLAGRGAQVVVLEKARPGAGATQGAFAMLIASHPEGPRALNDLYGMAVHDWRRLEAELAGALPIQWGGTVGWVEPGEAERGLAERLRRAQGWGSALQVVSAEEVARLVPGARPSGFGAGTFSSLEGTLDPQQAVDVLVAQAQRRGAAFRHPCEVKGLVLEEGRVAALETACGRIEADVVVVAAGAGTDVLARQAGAQAPHSLVSGALAHTAPHRRILHRVLDGPDFSLKQNPDGRIVTGPSYKPGAKAEEPTMAYGEKLLEIAAQTVPGVRGAKLEKMTVGFVPIPEDGQPIAGFAAAPANLYLALTMSGITMAPLLGRMAAMEILSGAPSELLAPYRPARFA